MVRQTKSFNQNIKIKLQRGRGYEIFSRTGSITISIDKKILPNIGIPTLSRFVHLI